MGVGNTEFDRRRFLQVATLTGAAVGLAPLRAEAATPHRTPAPHKTLGSGRRLFDLVARYSRWDHHRTGTRFERATVKFFETELRRRGATTARVRYPIDLFTWKAQVKVRGRSIPTLPVFQEAVGKARTVKPFVRSVTLPNAFVKTQLHQAIAEAAESGATIAVIPTFGEFPEVPGLDTPHLPYGPYPELFGVNVPADGPRSGVHTLLVSGKYADAIANGPVTATASSVIRPSSAENVVAWFGRRVKDPFIITTPLTGWFQCAGERGTGIAIALDLAADLAREGQPVLVVGTTGHEFEDYGVRQYLRKRKLTPRAVFHIGASAAAGVRDPATRKLTLAPVRTWKSTVDSDELTNGMGRGSFLAYPEWLGESTAWLEAIPEGTPLLSTSGSFPLFHTPSDRAHAATSPQLLATAYASMRAGALALL